MEMIYVPVIANTEAANRRRTWISAILLLVVLLCALITTGHQANAQVQQNLDAWKEEIAKSEETLLRSDLSPSDITKLRNRLEEIRAESLQAIESLRPELQALEKQAEQLKPAEDAGEEPPAIIEERTRVAAKLTDLQAVIKQLDVTALVAGQVSGKAAELQRTQFLRRIFEPGPSVFNPRFWIDGVTHSTALYERLRFIIKNWFTSSSETHTLVGWLVRLGLAFVTWLIIWPLRLRFQKLIGPDLTDPEPTDLFRLWRAAYLPLTNCLAVALAFGILIFLANHFTDVFTTQFGRIAAIGMYAFLWFVFLSSASRGVLSPAAPPWRLPSMNDQLAISLHRLFTLLAAVFAVNVFMTKVSSILFLPVEFTVMQGGILSALVTILLIAMLLKAGRGVLGETEDAAPVPATVVAAEPGYFQWTARIRGVLWLLAVAILAALFLGYVALASFLSEQFIITGLLILGVYLLHLLADEALTSGLARGLVLGNFVRRTFSVKERGIERLSLVLTTSADVLLLLIAVPLLVLQWTVTWIDLKSWLTGAFFGFKVGDVTISPSSILIAIAVFFVVLILSRFLVKWLDQRLLRRTNFDRGIRDSIKTAASYSGVILAALLAATYAGLDFTNLAIVAGALSVGIGFGLQSIVNNFVSGLILLAERPIRVGDWIVVGTDEGTVRKINVRATQIETFDRSTVIVPNSNLITSAVKNWTHSDKMGRLRIAVGVSYDADPERVRDLLLEVAAQDNMVMRAPEPYVYFMDFGASSLDFELRCYIFDVDEMITVLSNLRYAIFKSLKEDGIEIPFPQRDIHFKDMDRLEQTLGSSSRTQSSD